MFGGPGSGKSTMAARLFSDLKNKEVNVELVTEYAKDLTWSKSFDVLSNQLYVFAKQHQRMHRLGDKVDVIVTDSPLLNSLIYHKSPSEAFEDLVQEEADKYYNIDVFLERVKKYNPIGRNQTESEANLLDQVIYASVRNYGYRFDLVIPGNTDNVNLIIEKINRAIEDNKDE